MIPPRWKLIPLATLAAVFVTMPLALAQQRRVFTNDDISRAPAPAAVPVAPASTAAPDAPPTDPASGAPSAEAAPAVPAAAESLPQGVALAEHLLRVLQRYRTEIGLQLEQEVDSNRQARLSGVLDLITQLIVQNQLYIADLQAQQEAEAQAQAGTQPAP